VRGTRDAPTHPAVSAIRRISGGDFKIALTQNLFGLASLISVEPLDQQDAVEMVHLVLEDAALVLISLEVELVAVEVEADEMDCVSPRDLPTESGHRETALLVGPLAVGLENLGIDHHVGAVTLVVDEETLCTPTWLRPVPRRAPRHRLDHGLGEGRNSTVDVLDLGRGLGQDRIAVERIGSVVTPLRYRWPFAKSHRVDSRRDLVHRHAHLGQWSRRRSKCGGQRRDVRSRERGIPTSKS